ncbi:MAG: hypothetical protein ACRDQX_10760 [Pseudonocardiaceae bacterium]
MTATILGGALLGVATVSVAVYSIALHRLLTSPRRPGLIRTAACRVAGALLYLSVGVTTITNHRAGPVVGLGVFTAVQLGWQINSVLDIRIARRSLDTERGCVSHDDPRS